MQQYKLNQLAYIAHPKLWKRVCACITKGLRLCQPKSKAKFQTKAQVVAAVLTPSQAQNMSLSLFLLIILSESIFMEVFKQHTK